MGLGGDSSSDTTSWGVIVALFPIGGLISAQVAGPIADRYGRKAFLVYSSFVYMIAGFLELAAGLVSSQSGALGLMVVGRLFSGLGAGASSVVVPLYLGEIAPLALRGMFGTLAQFTLVIGILVSQLLYYPLGSEKLWPWLLSISGFLGVLQLICGPLLVESPRWLVTRGERAEAAKTLGAIRDGFTPRDCERAVEDIVAEAGPSLSRPAPSLRDVLTDASIRRPLVMCTLLSVAQQFSGINAVFYYSNQFFESAGLKNNTEGTLLASGVNVAATLLAVLLIERAGRRLLLLVGAAGMLVFSVALTVVLVEKGKGAGNAESLGWTAVVFVLLYVTFFEVGLGAIPWMIGGEIFPEAPRATAMGFAAGINWIANAIIGFIFPLMNDGLGNYSFVPFSAVLLVSFIYMALTVPETKNRSIADILAEFGTQVEEDRAAFLSRGDAGSLNPANTHDSDVEHGYGSRR